MVSNGQWRGAEVYATLQGEIGQIVKVARAHSMRMKQTKEPVMSIAGAIATPEPLRSLYWCHASW